MEHLFSILWLALAVSLDGFGAGVTYGIRHMRIPFSSAVIIAACSGLAVCVSMNIGGLLGSRLQPDTAGRMGALIFIGLGIWAIFQTRRHSGTEQEEPDGSKTPAPPRVWTLRIRPLGLVIQILKEPMTADLDGSGSISGREAVLLGSALALDSVGAGIGAAFVGVPAIPAAFLIAGMSALFLKMGMKWGSRFAGGKPNWAVKYVPGLMLVCLGFLRLF